MVAVGKGSRLRKQEATRKETVYWHGGAPGRVVGEELIPGDQVPGYVHLDALTQEDLAEYRPDFVYVTTDRDLAHDFAVKHVQLDGAAALYRVVPLDKPTHDPDYPAGVSFRCTAAKVTAVESDPFSDSTRLTGAALRYTTWDDNSRMYDESGYPLPNKLQRHFGVTPEHLRHLGYGAEFPDIHQRCAQVVMELNPGITQADLDDYLQRR